MTQSALKRADRLGSIQDEIGHVPSSPRERREQITSVVEAGPCCAGRSGLRRLSAGAVVGVRRILACRGNSWPLADGQRPIDIRRATRVIRRFASDGARLQDGNI